MERSGGKERKGKDRRSGAREEGRLGEETSRGERRRGMACHLDPITNEFKRSARLIPRVYVGS
jgi:hypothetical protein